MPIVKAAGGMINELYPMIFIIIKSVRDNFLKISMPIADIFDRLC